MSSRSISENAAVAPPRSFYYSGRQTGSPILLQVRRKDPRVLLGERIDEVKSGDFVWIEPNERHRLDSLGPEMLQFLCVVPDWGEPDAKNRPPTPGAC